MSFKFMHSKIDTRSAVPSLSEVVKLAQTKKALASGQGQVKTASAQQPTKVAKKKEAVEEVESEETEENGAFPGAAPKFKKKESKASTAPAKKVAEKEEGESSGQLAPKANPNNEPEKPEGGKASGGKGTKGGESDEGESSGQLDVEPLHQEGESTGQKPGGLDTQKEGEGKKEASKKDARFVRVAELTDKQKEFLRATWSLYWPKSFIDALLAAK